MQKSFSDLEYSTKKKLTRRDIFLAEIDSVTPWGKLHKLMERHYPKIVGACRPSIGLARMLRMYMAQQCLGFVGRRHRGCDLRQSGHSRLCCIDLNRESAPDATKLLKFFHLSEAKELTRQIFDTINAYLAEKGLMVREGSIVDATLIAAPPLTKNKDGKRDPEMHQSKKRIGWHFGMNAHIGVDAASGLVHTVAGCRIPDVSLSGLYEAQRRSSKPVVCKASLHLKAAFMASHQSYGRRRLVTAMANVGFKIGRYKVRRLMCKVALKPVWKHKFVHTTGSKHDWPITANTRTIDTNWLFGN